LTLLGWGNRTGGVGGVDGGSGWYVPTMGDVVVVVPSRSLL